MSDGVKCPALHDGMGVIEEWHDDDDDDDGNDDWDDRHRFEGRRDDDDDDQVDERRRRSGKLILVRNHEPAAGERCYRGESARHHLRVRRSRRHHQPDVRRPPGQVVARLVDVGRHHPQLRGRRYSVGYVDHQRRNAHAG